MRTHDDALSFILDIYDTLISPHINHRANANASLIGIRRNIYLKQFNAEFLRLIQTTNALAPSVDEHGQIVNLACTSSGLMIL